MLPSSPDLPTITFMTYGWTLNRECWSRFFLAIGSRTWCTVPFSILEKNAVPESYGVYVFCAKPCTTGKATERHLLNYLFNAVYVGQATNLRQRFVDHCNKPMEPMIAVRDCFAPRLEFWFTKLDSLKELCEVESVTIECLGPAANRQRGPVFKGKLCAGRPA
jgi:hypothetical protein